MFILMLCPMHLKCLVCFAFLIYSAIEQLFGYMALYKCCYYYYYYIIIIIRFMNSMNNKPTNDWALCIARKNTPKISVVIGPT